MNETTIDEACGLVTTGADWLALEVVGDEVRCYVDGRPFGFGDGIGAAAELVVDESESARDIADRIVATLADAVHFLFRQTVMIDGEPWVPTQAADGGPVIHVHVPAPVVNVTVPEPRPVRRELTRDPATGLVTGMTEVVQ
jgi:hypothetical protein